VSLIYRITRAKHNRYNIDTNYIRYVI